MHHEARAVSGGIQTPPSTTPLQLVLVVACSVSPTSCCITCGSSGVLWTSLSPIHYTSLSHSGRTRK
jgi:hypothetical protein